MSRRTALCADWRNTAGWILSTFALTLSGCAAIVPSPLQLPERSAGTVVRVVDGDTFELTSGEKVRLLGVDAPETQHPLPAVRRMGQASKEHLAGFVLGKEVELEVPSRNHDPYRRILAYAYLSDGTLINRAMIEDGYAMPYTKYPCSKTPELLKAASEARRGGRGLWQEAQFSTAAAYEVRLSVSGICHTPGNKGFERLKQYTPHNSLDDCLEAGGRLPRRTNSKGPPWPVRDGASSEQTNHLVRY